jgi:uncharacterized membrane protein
MDNYPQAVAAITRDYLERLNAHLAALPPRERDEFLREIRSHIYDAYQQTAGDNEVARILTVLRNLGEPAEVVCGRLPATMVRSGESRKLPLHVLAGVLIALFGFPLGLGGVAVLAGILVSLAGLVIAWYATLGSFLVTGAAFLLLGLIRVSGPGLWEKLVAAGLIHLDGSVAAFLNQLSPATQGVLLFLVAGVFVAAGVGMLWLGNHLVRGLRLLVSLVLNWLGKLTRGMRRRLAGSSVLPHSGRPFVRPA